MSVDERQIRALSLDFDQFCIGFYDSKALWLVGISLMISSANRWHGGGQRGAATVPRRHSHALHAAAHRLLILYQDHQ